MKRARAWRILMGLSLGLGSALVGCRPAEVSPAPGTATAPAVEISMAAPADAARSVLSCLRAEHAARRQHDSQAEQRCREQLLTLAARDVILQRYREISRAPAANPDKVLSTLVDSWSMLVAAYADGLQFDRMKATPTAADSDKAAVLVPAEAQAGKAVIRVDCIRGADGTWRVARLSFEPDRPATRPATASAP